jgi:hypothetical protein
MEETIEAALAHRNLALVRRENGTVRVFFALSFSEKLTGTSR